MNWYSAMVMMQQFDPSVEEAGAVLFCGVIIMVIMLITLMVQVAKG